MLDPELAAAIVRAKSLKARRRPAPDAEVQVWEGERCIAMAWRPDQSTAMYLLNRRTLGCA